MPSALSDDIPVIDEPSCRLLGPVALIVQGAMGAIVILTLVYKRYREHPPRPWRIWLCDVSKQVIGQMFVHGINVLISDVIARLSSGNACVFYFLNILIDTTLGIAIIYFMLHAMQSLLTDRFHLKGFESGVYGSPPSIKFWLRQAAVYVFSLTTMKLVVIALFALWPGIFEIGDWLLSWTGDGSDFQIVFVMGFFPIIMNCLQFWLIDSIVKASAPPSPVTLSTDTPRDSDDRDREPLFRSSYDDDDDDESARPRDLENQYPRPSSSSTQSIASKAATGDETKSAADESGSSAPAEGGSHHGRTFSMHAYPPSMTTASNSPTSSRLSSTSPHRSGRRRSPPAPLLPRSPFPPAINSPSCVPPGSARPVKPPNQIKAGVRLADANEGDSWDVQWEDDWAERVGQEDWTGRRLEARKEYVTNSLGQRQSIDAR